MLFEFGLKSSLLLIFFVHGIVFGIILLYKGLIRTSRSSLWLSLFVLLSALYIAPFMLGYAGWYSRQPYRDILFYTPFQQVLLLPPILYFSFKSVLYPSFSLSGRDWLHFAPAFMYIMYSLIIFIGDKIIIGDYYFYADQRDKDLDPWYQVAGFFSLLLLRRETNWDSFDLTMPNGEYKNVETNVSLSIRNISGLEYEVDINGAKRQGLLITRERMLVDNYQIEFGTTEGTSITSLKLNGERIKNVSFIKKK